MKKGDERSNRIINKTSLNFKILLSSKMNLAEPAPLVDPAKAAPAAVDDDDEYRVEPALEAKDEYKVESIKVDAAVPLDDPRKFAPTKQIDEPHR